MSRRNARRGEALRWVDAAIALATIRAERRRWSGIDGAQEPCLLWPYAAAVRGGYGVVRRNDRVQRVTRVLFEMIFGAPLHPKMHVLHSCDNPRCVNLAHLRPGTHAENVRDMVTRGRARAPRLFGEANGQAKLTATDVRAIRALAGTHLQREIAAQFGIDRANVSSILRGHTWRDVTDEAAA